MSYCHEEQNFPNCLGQICIHNVRGLLQWKTWECTGCIPRGLMQVPHIFGGIYVIKLSNIMSTKITLFWKVNQERNNPLILLCLPKFHSYCYYKSWWIAVLMFTSQVEPLLVTVVQVDCVSASYSVGQVSTGFVAENTICKLRVLQVLVRAGSAGFLGVS